MWTKQEWKTNLAETRAVYHGDAELEGENLYDFAIKEMICAAIGAGEIAIWEIKDELLATLQKQYVGESCNAKKLAHQVVIGIIATMIETPYSLLELAALLKVLELGDPIKIRKRLRESVKHSLSNPDGQGIIYE